MNPPITLPELSETDRQHPAVVKVLGVVHHQALIIEQLYQTITTLKAKIEQLQEEIAYLKQHKGRPKLRPSSLEGARPEADTPPEGKRPGSEKRPKTAQLEIHERCYLAAENVPAGSTFKGYQEYTVQDLEIRPHNTCYLIERWESPTGEPVRGVLPVAVQGRHFGPTLVSYILYQYYQCHVTQPLLLEALGEWGIDISAGQLNRLLIEGKAEFHAEKAALLAAGLSVSAYVHVDDTGARHQGQNGYCTHIGNEFFAWFESTSSKSRLNFLQLLRTGYDDYVLSEEALAYLTAHAFPRSLLPRLGGELPRVWADPAAWEGHLDELGITTPRHRRLATEAALLGSVLSHGVPKSLVIVSDEAGQFKLLDHALCWVHAERLLDKLVAGGEAPRHAVEATRTQLWALYDDLKAYKVQPTAAQKAALAARFDALFTAPTDYLPLQRTLQRLYAHKAELLLVLERPEIPLHNNLSEQDIREYVKRRKISGSTRSELGRQARDTFTSLKKTCRKLGISFWDYLRDRLGHLERIPGLPELVHQRARAP